MDYIDTTLKVQTPAGYNVLLPKTTPDQAGTYSKEHIDALEQAQNDHFAQLVRSNILHNWNLHKPVNRRALTSYPELPSVSYCIDRWKITNAPLTINDGYITFGKSSPAAGHASFYQIVEFPELYRGLTLTFSVKVRNTGANSARIRVSDNLTYFAQAMIPATGAWVTVSATGIVDANASNLSAEIVYLSGETATIDVQAVKLELGNTSTLANDPPMDLGKELTVCQRYQLVLSNAIVVRAQSIAANSIYFRYETPVPMRIAPTFIDNINVANIYGTAQPGFVNGVYIDQMTQHSLRFRTDLTAHGMTDAVIIIPAGTILDANL